MRSDCCPKWNLPGLVGAASILLSPAVVRAAILHVDAGAPPGGNGQNWTTAYNDLQDALDAAIAGDQVWVAQGTYTPDRGTGNRTLAFLLDATIAVYGGFAGGETELDQRDPVANPTLLSGDLNGNDGPGFQNNAENSHNVVRVTGLASTAVVVLDGFIISGGNANGGPGFNAGGGLYHDVSNAQCSLTVAQCRLLGNFATGPGGGVRLRRGIVQLVDCTFADNASNDAGAGAWMNLTAIAVTGCAFDANVATERGGGLYLSGHVSDIALSGCTFAGNLAGFDGGGVFSAFPNLTGRTLTVDGCLFESNVATGTFSGDGGGLYAKDVLVDLSGSSFVGNTTKLRGGGAYLEVTGAGAAVNCDFRGNEAMFLGGGGVYLATSSVYQFSNDLFDGNVAAGDGGGLLIPTSGGGPGRRIVNCTFAANTSGTLGGGFSAADTDDTIDNSVLWANADSSGSGQAAQLRLTAPPGAVNYCCIQGWNGSLGGAGNHGNDPLFVDADGGDGVAGNGDDDLRLGAGSPGIDAASNPAVAADELDVDGDGNVTEPIPLDLAGNPRFIDDPASADSGNGTPPLVDMGAYEFGEISPVVQYVGPAGGTWFAPSHWSSGSLPDGETDVSIGANVVVDQAGALARDIQIGTGGSLVIQAGTLTARDVTLLAGGTLQLAHAAAVLEVRGLSVQPGAQVQWVAGTIRIVGGVWISPAAISVGCSGAASLVLEDGGAVLAPAIDICTGGSASGQGTLQALVTCSGQVSPGTSAGALQVSGDYIQTASGTLSIELGGYAAGSEYDTFVVSGQATLAGTLEVTLLGGFLHQVGGLQTLITANPVADGFVTTNIPSLPGDVTFIYQADAASISLRTMLTLTGPRLHVDASHPGGGDGQSWTLPISTLQGALEVVDFFPGEVEEIWTANGTYRPTKRTVPGNPLTATFSIVEGVSMYGGFAGGETSLDQRDPVANPTVLSGDLAGDDGPDFANNGENAIQVVSAVAGNPYTQPTDFDGFVVTAATSSGLFNAVATPTIRACVFIANNGRGLRLHSTSLVEGCSFVGNTGSGLWVEDGFTDPVIQDCLFQDNGGANGAGLYFAAQQGSVIDCMFVGNNAAGSAGNGGGGGAWCSDGVRITNCIFSQNNARYYGGGLYVAGGAGAAVTNCLFTGNTTGVGFGDGRDGAAICVDSPDFPKIDNCTMAGNTAARFQGGIATRTGASTVDVANCIIWDNSDSIGSGESAQIGGPGSFSIDYSCVEGWSGAFGGAGNIGDDPLFVAAGDLRLQPGSPCIDAGDNSAVPPDLDDLDGDTFTTTEPVPLDLDGNQRFFDDPGTPDSGNGSPRVVDMGAYEFGAPAVDPGLYVGPPGASWFNPANWSGGALPDAQTDALILSTVVVDQPGAVARNVLVAGGGTLTIESGSLSAVLLVVEAGGTLRLDNPAALLEVGTLVIHPAGILDWIAGTIRIVGGTWSNDGALAVGCLGTATLILADDATVSATTIDICTSGQVRGNGTLAAAVSNSGQLAPGVSPGTITIDGDYAQGPGGTLAIEVNGYAAGSEHDLLEVTGTASLGGTLGVTVAARFEPVLVGLQFMTAASVQGAFSASTLPGLSDGFALHLEQGAFALRLLATPPGPIVYVKADVPGPAPGTSWAEAAGDLQLALAAAGLSGGAITEIWVAAGKYVPVRPAVPTNARTASFSLQSGVAAYGGFAGDELLLEERDVLANVTTLSGDVGGDDGPGFANIGENLYHVVTALGVDATAIMDGFTILGGNAGLGANPNRGGGLLAVSSGPTLGNCVFASNWADAEGGAIFNGAGSNPAIEACAFNGNTSNSAGGAIANAGASSPSISGCTFDGNNGGASGGAIANTNGSSPTITDCVFTGNVTDDVGGAISNDAGCNPEITQCSFVENSAPIGGGAIYSTFGSPLVANCVFTTNSVGNLGGAVYNLASTPTFVSCTFLGNVSGSRGGALANNAGADVLLIGCLFSANYAERDGGALHGFLSGATLINCTLAFNVADFFDGGGLHNSSSLATLSNCILWGNTANFGQVNEEAQVSSGSVTINYSCVQGWSGALGGAGNIGADPRFVNPAGPDGQAGTQDDNLQLFFNSACIDAGSNSDVPPDIADLDSDGDTVEEMPADLAGSDRRADDLITPDSGEGEPPVVDMGAYEFGPVCAGCPGERLWIDPAGGSFGAPGNWHPDAPATTDGVVFDLGAQYTVSFSGSAANDHMIVTDGQVTLALNGNVYDLTNAAQDSLNVGVLPGKVASLTISGGAASAESVRVGGQPGSSGQLIVDGADMDVASTLHIGDGAPGSVVLANGGTLTAGISVLVHEQGAIHGDGTMVGLVTNLGIVAPGSVAAGVLTVDGDYQQPGQAAGPGSAGATLSIDIGTDHDLLEVLGEALLGGRLVVTAGEGFTPALGQTFTILAAGSISGAFDIAFLPSLSGGLVLALSYDDGGQDGQPSVDLTVEELDVGLFGFGAPVGFGSFDPATDALVTDVEGDGDLDIVLTVHPPDPGGPNPPGSVLVFRNLGLDGSGNWNGFDPTPVETLVQQQPVSLASGHFNADAHLDLAVANFQFGTVSVLLNNGQADGTFTESDVFPVDDGARALAAGALYGPTADDLVVLSANLNRQRFFQNDSSANFSLLQTVNGPSLSQAIGTLDIDGDKDPEVVVAAGSQVQVTFRNVENGEYGLPIHLYPVTSGTVGFESADLDVSGFADILTINEAAGLVSVLVNLSDQSGALAPAIDLQVGAAPSSLQMVDFDADGDLDLAIAAEDELGDRVVRLKRNNLIEDGALSFTDAGSLAPAAPVTIVLTGDLDQDGKPDLVAVGDETSAAAAGAGGSLTILLNATGAASCPADIDGDGNVGVVDFLALLGAWGTDPGGPPDLDGDGNVGVVDFLQLLATWGPCP